jgi:hypothetical protein
MKRVPLVLAFAFVCIARLPAAAPAMPPPSTATTASALSRDLGRGLFYQRVNTLPSDLPAPETAHRRPTVLDLRYVHADADAATALVGWLKFNASLHTPVFVLANSETDRAIVQALANRGAIPSALVIGIPARGFSPDIAVQATPEAERRAYDALAAGVDATSLITENSDKARNDEASLSRDRSTEPGVETARDRAPAPPLDAALQRAVHLHRALVALKKI